VQTEISAVDGPNSTLLYRGINIHELAEQASYEEVAFLLLNGHLPNRSELADFNARLVANRWLPAPLYDLLRSLPRDSVPMEALRVAVSALSFYDPEIEDISIEATQRKAVRLIAQLPTLCAAYQRLREGKQPIAPNPRLSHAANTLYMLGVELDPGLRTGHQYVFHSAGRPRHERQHVHCARRGQHAGRSALGHLQRVRLAQGPAAWRSQRSDDAHVIEIGEAGARGRLH
jgi:citrate synthase